MGETEKNRGQTPIFRIQKCLDCGRHRYPATRYCAGCRGERSEMVAPAGGATVESHCVFHKAYWPEFQGKVPYAVVQVKLDEGVQLFSNLVGVPPERIRPGMRVRASYEGDLVKFVPA